jgi:hypothetical protein
MKETECFPCRRVSGEKKLRRTVTAAQGSEFVPSEIFATGCRNWHSSMNDIAMWRRKSFRNEIVCLTPAEFWGSPGQRRGREEEARKNSIHITEFMDREFQLNWSWNSVVLCKRVKTCKPMQYAACCRINCDIHLSCCRYKSTAVQPTPKHPHAHTHICMVT